MCSARCWTCLCRNLIQIHTSLSTLIGKVKRERQKNALTTLYHRGEVDHREENHIVWVREEEDLNVGMWKPLGNWFTIFRPDFPLFYLFSRKINFFILCQLYFSIMMKKKQKYKNYPAPKKQKTKKNRLLFIFNQNITIGFNREKKNVISHFGIFFFLYFILPSHLLRLFFFIIIFFSFHLIFFSSDWTFD